MEWDEIHRVLTVVAHPDDAEFGSAGTAAKMAREGKQVFYAIVTDGSKGSNDPEMTPQRLVDIRRSEQCEAARRTGVADVDFLNFPDGMLQPTLEVRKAIAATIRRFKPDVVISPNPTRDLRFHAFAQHPDHLACGEATLAAVYPTARDRLTFPELLAEGLEPHAVSEVWISGGPDPDFYVDITETLETKLHALAAHESQVEMDNLGDRIRERTRAVGQEAGYEYAEAFRRLRLL
jgi:LmbE family N-acetylglucosaminyl deacetylase